MLNYFLFSVLLGLISAVSSFDAERENRFQRSITTGLAVFIFFGAFNYWATPTLSFWGFSSVWFQMLFACIIGLIAYSCKESNWGETYLDSDGLKYWNISPVATVVLLFVIQIISSMAIFRAQEYSKLLNPTEVNDSVFVNSVHPIPVEKMINVKKTYAEDLASKRIESIPSLGSICQFGDADMININGTFDVKTADGKELTLTFDNEKVWVMVLEHRGFWKWSKNKTTNGYCIVSAHDPSKIYFITEVNGKPLSLKYLRSGYFGTEIERHVRANGYADRGLTDFSVELDDNGIPYWVITLYRPTIGMMGNEASGAIIVDMQSGEIKEYSINDAPQWVDLIQPKEFVYEQINDWGSYQKGWFNAVFAENGLHQATPGMSLVYSDGRSYWYTGIQSKGADESSSGFMLIDTRTKECKKYSISGINEVAAKSVISAQSEWVRMSKLTPNDPVLYNVHGVPTYYMTLTGDGTKNAGYAFVSLKNELHFAAANTPQKALQQYLNVIQNDNLFRIEDGDKIIEETRELTVRMITQENGLYYILFQEVKGKEFTAISEAFPEVKWAKDGQKVNVSFTDTEANVISLNSFDIINFEI